MGEENGKEALSPYQIIGQLIEKEKYMFVDRRIIVSIVNDIFEYTTRGYWIKLSETTELCPDIESHSRMRAGGAKYCQTCGILLK